MDLNQLVVLVVLAVVLVQSSVIFNLYVEVRRLREELGVSIVAVVDETAEQVATLKLSEEVEESDEFGEYVKELGFIPNRFFTCDREHTVLSNEDLEGEKCEVPVRADGSIALDTSESIGRCGCPLVEITDELDGKPV